MAEDEFRCAMPCSTAQHGSLVRPTSGQFESEAVFTTHALCAAASFGRIFILSLLSLSATLSGMSADKLRRDLGVRHPGLVGDGLAERRFAEAAAAHGIGCGGDVAESESDYHSAEEF